MNQRANPITRLARLMAVIALPLALPLALGGCDEGPALSSDPGEPPLAGADIGGEFELVNSSGETVRWSDFDGQYRIIYFGYAYCPDECPTDVQRTMQGYSQFAEQDAARAAKIQPIFVSGDPERDSGVVLDQFTRAFSDDLLGLTGSPEQIAEVAETFRVFFIKGEVKPDGSYLVSHSRIAYLFGPDGQPIATLPHDEGADAVTAELDRWVS